MACEDRQIVIFASELASAIGKHRYSPRSETLCKVWRRNHEKSFCFVHCIVLRKEVCTIISDISESSAKLKELTRTEDWFLEALRKIVLDYSFRSLYEKILKLVNMRVFAAARENRIIFEANQISNVVEHMKDQITTLCKDESKTIEEAVEEICQKTGVKTAELKQALKSKLTKDRGTHLEQTAVQTFGKSKGIEIKRVAPKLYYKTMEHDGVKWRVCGKIDAQAGDQIIEVKNRKNRFMCPIYDCIQLQTYLFLCDKTQGVLLERLKGANKETSFPFDEEFWREEVTPELGKFVMELSKYIETGKDMLYGKSKALSLSPARKRNVERDESKCEEVPGSPPKMLAVESNGLPVQSKAEIKQLTPVIESNFLPTEQEAEPNIKGEMHSCIATCMPTTSYSSEMQIVEKCETHSCKATDTPSTLKRPEIEKELEIHSCIATDLSSSVEEIEEPMSPVY